MKDETPFKGMGSVLYGDIDDLLAYLALIPDEGRMVRMWERSLDKRLLRHRYEGEADIIKVSDPESYERVTKEIMGAGQKLVEDADTVREVLGIDVSENFAKDWTNWIMEFDYDAYALRAINGKSTGIGKGLFVKLTGQQADHIFGELKKLKFIEGKPEHFRSMFTGDGVFPSFERLRWLEIKQVLLRLLFGLKHESRSNKEMALNASYFFADGNGQPIELHTWKIKDDPTTALRVEEIERILATLPK